MEKMSFADKKEFLEFAKDLARNLEGMSNDFIVIHIGWIESPNGDLKVHIALNHPEGWFLINEKSAWNETVIWNNINNFVPIKKDYLVLNELIEKAHNNHI